MSGNGRSGCAGDGSSVAHGLELFARDRNNKIGKLAARLSGGRQVAVSGLVGGSAFVVAHLVAPKLLYITGTENRRASALRALKTLRGTDCRAVCLTIDEAARKTVSPSFLKSVSVRLEAGGRADRDEFIENLVRAGYENREFVRLRGEMSVRGAIVDLFCGADDSPLRVEFSGDEVRSLRFFDPNTQMSVEKTAAADITPMNVEGAERNSSVFDRLEKDAVVFVESRNDMSLSEALEGNAPETHLNAREFERELERRKTVRVLTLNQAEIDFETSPAPVFGSIRDTEASLASQGYGVKVMSGNKNIPKMRGEGKADVYAGTVGGGFVFPEIGTAFIEADDYGEKTAAKKTVPSSAGFESAFGEIKNGDLVVHREFGIGIFRGLKNISVRGYKGDFIECEYRNGDSVYVPVSKFKLIHRYVGSEEDNPRIDRLGGATWKKTVRGAKRATETVAKELLELYASRKSGCGHGFSKPGEDFREFEADFMFEETPDQKKAIEDVMADMESPRPMDRLICGDTGFGKTEVAFRAAVKAVMDGFQVAFLTPTTLLVSQHLRTACARLERMPVRAVALSRFNSPREEKTILDEIERGTADIVIGTHKILGSKVRFRNLGLLIVDEEHKFGVKQKEKLKTMRHNLDVLSLSATPIPRTLQLSLATIRDISTISSPPRGRIPARIKIQRWDARLIRDMVMKEKARGGGVFFIHNRIRTIGGVARRLAEMLPGVSMEVTHGRMGKKDLEDRVGRFARGEIDMLVTTAIVESGLDIAGANTIFINDAHTFGMADLYQMKGRVGRGSVQAYACLLVPDKKTLGKEAWKRLERFSELWDFGGGYELAFSDLRMRGVGNLFGVEQSGHVAGVGVEFYLEMLRETIERLKNGKVTETAEPEIRTDVQARIPDDYVENGRERLTFYKRISSSSTMGEINSLKKEITDRFGPPPRQTKNLFTLVALKTLLRKHSVGFMNIKSGSAEAFASKDRPEPVARFLRDGGGWKALPSADIPQKAADSAARMLSSIKTV